MCYYVQLQVQTADIRHRRGALANPTRQARESFYGASEHVDEETRHLQKRAQTACVRIMRVRRRYLTPKREK